MASRQCTTVTWSAKLFIPTVLCIGMTVSAVGPAQAEIRLAQLFGKSKRTAEMQVRIDGLEQKFRAMTGQIEELNHQIRLLEENIRRMQEDNEFRFQEIEGNAPGARKRTQAGGQEPAVVATVPQQGETDTPANAELARIGRAVGTPLDLSAVAKGRRKQVSLPPGVVAPDVPETPRDAYDLAYDHFLGGNYGRSEAGFRRFLDVYSDHQLAADAQFWVGESLYAQGEFKDAADAFLKSYTDYPDSRMAPDSLLKLALALAGLKEADAACATYNELLMKYPEASRAVLTRARYEMKSAKC
jgi:tol-pal system protein YbgF